MARRVHLLDAWPTPCPEFQRGSLDNHRAAKRETAQGTQPLESVPRLHIAASPFFTVEKGGTRARFGWRLPQLLYVRKFCCGHLRWLVMWGECPSATTSQEAA